MSVSDPVEIIVAATDDSSVPRDESVVEPAFNGNVNLSVEKLRELCWSHGVKDFVPVVEAECAVLVAEPLEVIASLSNKSGFVTDHE